jgi:hypothetical protein
MTDPRAAWEEVGDRLSALALKLKLHAQEELSDDDLRERSGFDKLAKAVEETFDALEDAAEDEAVRDDVRQVGRALVGALDATLREARRTITRS